MPRHPFAADATTVTISLASVSLFLSLTQALIRPHDAGERRAEKKKIKVMTPKEKSQICSDRDKAR